MPVLLVPFTSAMNDAGMLRGKLEGRPDASVGLKGTEQELSGPNKNGHAAALWEGKVSRNGSLSFYFLHFDETIQNFESLF